MPDKTRDHVTWSNTYSVGIEVIDNQHKGLLDFVNDLFNHATGDEEAERSYFTLVIHQAVQYIKEHFSTEEKILIAVKFPGYAEHKKLHDTFTLQVVNSVREFEAGKRLVLSKLARFLRNWILEHIAVMDARYAAYLREIASRKADGKPSIAERDIK